jgi:hypothetical protein
MLVVKGDPTTDVTVLQDADNLVYILQNGAYYKSPVAA